MPTFQNKLQLFITGDLCVKEMLINDPLDSDLTKIIEESDYCVANLEGPVIKDSYNPIKKAGPHIYQQTGYEFFLQENRFNIVSLANNHILDYGKDGLKNTLDIIEKYKIHSVGAAINFPEVYKPLIICKEGVKIALFSLAEGQFGCSRSIEYPSGFAWIMHPEITHAILSVRQEVDFIIILAHAGLEMCYLPLPEWRDIYRNFIDLGADLVVGSHPHVIQGKEMYKGKLIYYSLGNFFFNGGGNNPLKDWSHSIALKCIFNSEHKHIKIDEFYLHFDDRFLSFEENTESEILFNENSRLLLESNISEYYSKINDQCIEAWKSYYKNYYSYYSDLKYKSGVENKSIILKKALFEFVKRYIVRPYQNDVLLYHNISIETHRFAVERALRNINNIY